MVIIAVVSTRVGKSVIKKKKKSLIMFFKFQAIFCEIFLVEI